MKVLFVASEAGPVIRTGGLGDVAAALPKALKEEGTDVRIVLPLYDDIPKKYKEVMQFVGSTNYSLGWRTQYVGVFTLTLDGIQYYFIDNEYYFKRQGIYGFYDDGERFSYFDYAVLSAIPVMQFYPDVIHCNDWQTGLIPVYLDAYFRLREGYQNIKTAMTIHNIEFQGNMDVNVIKETFGIPDAFYNVVEYKGDANMLKAGIERSNAVTTVSKTYANEIMMPFFAYGLENILRDRSYKIHGILNGIDIKLYDPMKDSSLFQHYSTKTLTRKINNKTGLQKMLNLPVRDDVPMITMVTRLTSQKGLDLVMAVIEDILYMDVQMVVLGTGDERYENAFRELQNRFPTKLSAIINFSKDIASKIYAAGDIFLMPSKYEPCGLSQMIALRYGNIPVVRETGGLKDTVPAFNPVDKTGRGFTFKSFNAHDMLDAIRRAVSAYSNKSEWRAVMTNAMNGDYSWKNSAKEYLELYKSL